MLMIFKKKSKLLSFILSFISLMILIFTSIKVFHIDKNQQVLNFFARYYFDKNYYLETYPEIKDLNIDPFDHYSSKGWKEGKNPSKDFNTKFYINYREENKKYHIYNKRHELNPLQDYVRSLLFFRSFLTNPNNFNKKTVPLKNPKHYLAIVAIFRDEAPYLKEWIEYHRLLGVEHFYLFNHLSTDNYQEVLDPYIKSGIIELHTVTSSPKNDAEWSLIQTNAYSSIIKEIRETVEWLAMIDTDEFLLPIHDNDLKTVLKRYDDHACLSINWKMFGSGNVQQIEPQKTMIESLTMCSSEGINHTVKSIVKPRYVKKLTSMHFPILDDNYAQITENYDYFFGTFSPTKECTTLRINHYWARDWNFFLKTKMNRVHMIEKNLINNQIQINNSMSTTYDDLILRFVPELRKRMDFPPQ